MARGAIGLAFLVAAHLWPAAGPLRAHGDASIVPTPQAQRPGRDLGGSSGPVMVARDPAADARAHLPNRHQGALRHPLFRGRPRRPAAPPFHGGPNGVIASHPFTRPGSPGRSISEQGRHGGFIAWYGPVFWPYAYDDLFEYLLWPTDDVDYDGAFWLNAFAAILDPALAPAPVPAAARPRRPAGSPSPAKRSRAGVRGLAGQSREYAEICGGRMPGRTGWPAERLSRTVEPTPGQSVTLDAFKAAATAAARLLNDACTKERPTSRVARLDAMERRLEAMRQAVAVIRPTLDGLYGGLSDTQKAGLDGTDTPDQDAESLLPQSASSTESICGPPQPAPAPSLPEFMTPPQSQRDALSALAHAVASAVERLHAACPVSAPRTLPARLTALETRLRTMLEAIRIERPALAAFADALGHEPAARANDAEPVLGR